jgi:hypothetical protein
VAVRPSVTGDELDLLLLILGLVLTGIEPVHDMGVPQKPRKAWVVALRRTVPDAPELPTRTNAAPGDREMASLVRPHPALRGHHRSTDRPGVLLAVESRRA